MPVRDEVGESRDEPVVDSAAVLACGHIDQLEDGVTGFLLGKVRRPTNRPSAPAFLGL
jgi:hypothetical protein